MKGSKIYIVFDERARHDEDKASVLTAERSKQAALIYANEYNGVVCECEFLDDEETICNEGKHIN